MLKIRIAEIDEFNEVRAFYHSLIDALKDAEYKPAWEKGVYPADDYLKDALEKKELFVGTVDGNMAAAMVINHEYNESYDKVKWPMQAAKSEIMVIHALGVHSDFSGKGYAKELVEKAIEVAKDCGQKAIRLDVLNGNLPAVKLYTGKGFQYVDTIQMYYEDTGWTDFELYEYQIK